MNLAALPPHPFTDFDLVRDTEFGETFVFNETVDGLRARSHPGSLRKATPQEAQAFRLDHPNQHFNC
jgi:hypothetical protein